MCICRVWGVGLRVKGLRFKVQGLEILEKRWFGVEKDYFRARGSGGLGQLWGCRFVPLGCRRPRIFLRLNHLEDWLQGPCDPMLTTNLVIMFS